MFNIYNDLQKKYGKKNTFLFSSNQIVMILSFDEEIIGNMQLRHQQQSRIAEDVIKYIENKKYILNNSQYYIAKLTIGTGSVGTIFKETEMDEVVKLSHFAQLKAKEKGEKIVIADEQLRITKKDSDSFYKEMEKGFELDQFTPFFMPIINPKTMKISGCESLVRWRKDKYRIIETSKFYDIALEKNLFEKIDIRVMEKTFQCYHCWNKLNFIGSDFFIAFNMTLKTLVNLDMDEFESNIKKYKLMPHNIEFDVSFNEGLTNKEIDKIKDLKEKGFKIAYDEKDSKISLQLLNELVFNKIKINIPDKNNSNNYLKIFKTLVKVSKLFKYDVMAKRIETKEDLEDVKNMNVDFAQGYYFSKPLDADNFETFLYKYKNGIG
ncbi:MAG: EAL domain-containing protein [Clostridia bacterium]|nr:EAL domain-containing protein [Clostridia bacterium]